jgi:hypothetical protein
VGRNSPKGRTENQVPSSGFFLIFDVSFILKTNSPDKTFWDSETVLASETLKRNGTRGKDNRT